jgi:hypothetical protein
MSYTPGGRRALPYPQHRKSVDEGIAEGYLSACEQENRELRAQNERLRAAMEGLLKYMVAMNVYTDRALAVQDAESALYGDA